MANTSEIRNIDTGTDDLLARIEGNLGVITFNRPASRNALSTAMYAGFDKVLPELAADADVRALLITGEGGAFCAGGDVKAMNASHTSGEARTGQATDLEGRVAQLRSFQRSVSLAIHEFRRPVIAALPGAAAGAGFSIALAADIRLASENALLVTAFANVGASGDFGGSWFLTQLVGPAKAKELYFTSPRLTAAEAQDLGLVNQVLPAEGFAEAALAWCHNIADQAPIAMEYMKQNLNRALTADLSSALEAEAAAMVRAMSTADHREAAAAFVEKRTPVYTGE